MCWFDKNEEIVRRYPGSDNGGNYVIDKGKGSGPRSHDYGKVGAEELGDFDAIMFTINIMSFTQYRSYEASRI